MKAILASLYPLSGTLTTRLATAAGWNLAGTGSEFVLRLASNLIMTRLLMPDAFGLMAFAMVFATAVSLLTDIGIRQSIVREKDMLGPLFLRTAWTVKIVRSLVIALAVLSIAGVLWLVGPWLGQDNSVLAHPQIPLLIALTALAPPIEGLISTNWDVCMRRMQYKRIVLLTVGSNIFRILCQISFALVSPTVWALLVGTLAGNFGRVILSHLFLPGPKMRLVWDRSITRSLWSFGKWIMGSSIMTFLAKNSDKLVFGATVSSVTMGLYVIAFIWIGAGQRVMAVFIGNLGFPMISEVLRDSPNDARRLLRRYQNIVDFMTISGFTLLVLCGPLLVRTLYTPVYVDAGVLIQLLAPLILALRFDQLANFMVASGNSKGLFYMSTSIGIATVVFMGAGLQFSGFEAAVTGMVLARFVAVPYLLRHTYTLFGGWQTLYDALFCAMAVSASLTTYVLIQTS